MTDKEYREAINAIVKNGRGFDAIADITKQMDNICASMGDAFSRMRKANARQAGVIKAVRGIAGASVKTNACMAQIMTLTEED